MLLHALYDEPIEKAPPLGRAGVFRILTRGGFGSAGADVDGFRAFLALSDLVLDCLTVVQRPETFHGYVGVMDKQILTAIVGDDESESLPLVEPFYFAFIHDVLLGPFLRPEI